MGTKYGKGIFVIEGKKYELEAGRGFLIPPEELAFYAADETEPWTYIWVGFSGSKAQEYINGIGLSSHAPVFQSEEHEGLYACVKDMMEHSTYSVANELRRVGQLLVFLSMIAKEKPIQEEEENKKQRIPKSDRKLFKSI